MAGSIIMLGVFQRLEPDIYKAQSKVARELLTDFLSTFRHRFDDAQTDSLCQVPLLQFAAATAVDTLAWVSFLKMGPGASVHQTLDLQPQQKQASEAQWWGRFSKAGVSLGDASCLILVTRLLLLHLAMD